MKTFALTTLIALSSLGATAAYADAVPGNKAPDFEVTDANGKVQKLSDYSNKWVVLEWFNKDCPYVKKHYGSQNMQGLQKKYLAKGVVWLTVNSANPNAKQGYEEPAAALKTAAALGATPTAILRDTTGKLGKDYGAKTTPHMFVINPAGLVAYAGAIDDNDSSAPKVIKTSKNFVAAALDEGLAGTKIAVASHKPYGCGVKYE